MDKKFKKIESEYCTFLKIQKTTLKSGLMAVFRNNTALQESKGYIDLKGKFHDLTATDWIGVEKLEKRRDMLISQKINPVETDKAIAEYHSNDDGYYHYI
ncbi:hypothetical protein [Martelella radicis]|uniref:Uncharacterized protein n=1 Tax=Martelella radicis TaxID=1397476 RepID=A0A7W6PB24_9HYPH|nr:hypothetical protein [Martelella radicis]MBB4123967.1 hypothetical protein [Martelella radicis]